MNKRQKKKLSKRKYFHYKKFKEADKAFKELLKIIERDAKNYKFDYTNEDKYRKQFIEELRQQMANSLKVPKNMIFIHEKPDDSNTLKVIFDARSFIK